jgi:hypothetical protein
MAKPGKKNKKKQVKVHDLEAKRNPKGGVLSSSILKKKDDTGNAVIQKI